VNRKVIKPAAEYPKAGFNLLCEDKKRIQSSPFIFLTKLQLKLVSTVSSRPIKFKVNIPCIGSKSRFFLMLLSVLPVLLTCSEVTNLQMTSKVLIPIPNLRTARLTGKMVESAAQIPRNFLALIVPK